MIRGKKLLGLDMAKRINRRLLVVITYATFAVALSAAAARHPYLFYGDFIANFLIALLIVGRVVFGYLVPWYPMPHRYGKVSSQPEILSVTDPQKTDAPLDDDWAFPDPDEPTSPFAIEPTSLHSTSSAFTRFSCGLPDRSSCGPIRRA
jgi:hypothetical protein